MLHFQTDDFFKTKTCGKQEPLAQNRLLIISVSTAIRQSRVTAMARNKYVCEMADRILFVGVTEQSSLYSYKNEFRNKLEESI